MSDMEFKQENTKRKVGETCSCSEITASLIKRVAKLERNSESESKETETETNLSQDSATDMKSGANPLDNKLDEIALLISEQESTALEKQFSKLPKPEDEYDDRSILSQGSFGTTHRMINSITNTEFAVMEIRVKELTALGLTLAAVLDEVTKLQSINHSNIVRYFSNFIGRRDTVLSIVMEYLPEGSIASKIGDVSVGVKIIEEWLTQTVSALRYLHKEKLMQHGSIRPENILLSCSGSVKLLFDVVPVKKSLSTSQGELYDSYEKVNKLPYDGRDDVWGLGCVITELLLKKRLSFPITSEDIRDRIVSAVVKIDAQLGLIVSKMLGIVQATRSTSEELSKCLVQPKPVAADCTLKSGISSYEKICNDARLAHVSAHRFNVTSMPSKNVWKESSCNQLRGSVSHLCTAGSASTSVVAYFVKSMFGTDGDVVFQTNTKTSLQTFTRGVNFMRIRSDGTQLAVAEANCLLLYTCDSGSWDLLFRVPFDGRVSRLNFSTKSEIVVAVDCEENYSSHNKDGYTFVIDSATRKILVKLNVSSSKAMQFYRNCETMLVAGYSSLSLIEGLSKISLKMEYPKYALDCCCIFDKTLLIGRKHTIYVYDVSNRHAFVTPDLWVPTPIHTVAAHTSTINCLLPATNGLVLSCSNDKTIKIWNASTFACLHILEGHTESVKSISLINGGIVSISDDKTLRYWSQE